jgi:hypothetical protein
MCCSQQDAMSHPRRTCVGVRGRMPAAALLVPFDGRIESSSASRSTAECVSTRGQLTERFRRRAHRPSWKTLIWDLLPDAEAPESRRSLVNQASPDSSR